jgi:hypothetical protein
MLNVLVTFVFPCASVPQVVGPFSTAGAAATKPLFVPVRLHVSVKSRESIVEPAGMLAMVPGVTMTVPPEPPAVVVYVTVASVLTGDAVSAAFDKVEALNARVFAVTVTTALAADAGTANATAHAVTNAASRNFTGREPRSNLR